MEQDRFAALEKRIAKLEAVHEIQNLMGRLTYMYEGGEYEQMLDQFAKKAKVTAEVSQSGRLEGLEGAKKVIVDSWVGQYKMHEKEMRRLYPEDENPTGRNGIMDLQALSSPVIEVADDLQTARGMWYAPTVATECHPGDEMPTGHHVWLKFAVDFIYEDGRWRVWHYHLMPFFNTAWNKSWVESSLMMEKMFSEMPPGAMPEPEGPVTAYHAYSVHEPPCYDPVPPEPYSTFDDVSAY